MNLIVRKRGNKFAVINNITGAPVGWALDQRGARQLLDSLKG